MSAIEQQGMGALIGSIYEAALDGQRWTDFLRQLAERFNSSAAMIWAHDFTDRSAEIDSSSGSIATFHGLDPMAMADFANYYCQHNVWTEDPLLHQAGQIVTSSSLYPDAQLKHTEYYNDWLRHQQLFYSSAAIVCKREDRSMNVTLVRNENAGGYSTEEQQLLALLMPHLQAAFALHQRLHKLEVLSHASLGALESCAFGVVLIDERARVLFANSLAQRLAGRSDLLRFAREDCLQAVSATDNAVLQRSLHAAVQTGRKRGDEGGGAMRLRHPNGAALDLVIAPLPGWASPFGQHSAAVVFISDPQASMGSLSLQLRSIYGMTPAEARLSEALVHGLTPQEYAERQQLSLHTVRAQFKAAASKAGTHRQADLVRIILTGPAVLRAGVSDEAI